MDFLEVPRITIAIYETTMFRQAIVHSYLQNNVFELVAYGRFKL